MSKIKDTGFLNNSFIRNLAYIFGGNFLGFIFYFLLLIIAGKILGPVEFGKYSLLESTSMFLYLPMLLGLNVAQTKYISETDDKHIHTGLISTTYILTISFIIFWSLFYLLVAEPIAKFLSLTDEIFNLSIILSISFSIYTLILSSFQGLFKMKHIGWLKILRSFLALLFFLLIYAHDRSFKTLLYSTSAGYIIPSVLFLALFLGKYFKLQLERNIISTLILYGFLNSVRALSATVYTYSDKILINKFLTLGDVGLYRIYYLSSLNLLSSLFVIFNTVFFPSASRERNKHLFLSKINRSVPLTFTFSFLISLLSEFAVFKFIGDEYTFDLKLSVIFAITSGIFVLARLYSWFLTSTGTAGAKISSTGEILTALSNILFNFILIPRLQISGAILSSLLSYLLLLAIVHPNKYPNLLR